ncbi:hypothetical protein QV06_00520 [Gallibacterium genomosp. 3]|uniref:Uncharacterized protein n=1 Tax=Gallibacterium genomosp. 3 TaxID=505345 RepID=A0A1A7PVZ9_9PAST|nr:hypothetical protein [Gallibacterium genomosp. 3]OBX05921.1 hypothetical protein QV06_00520 [Gallibacterium genomosp. 3]
MCNQTQIRGRAVSGIFQLVKGENGKYRLSITLSDFSELALDKSTKAFQANLAVLEDFATLVHQEPYLIDNVHLHIRKVPSGAVSAGRSLYLSTSQQQNG